MKKDVIYIDTEDDITEIIGRVKHASAPIVALVPPKRIGILQSTVNLKLLQRAAESVDKRVVLITSDPALTALAGGLAFPIAKNLQSKPEIAELTAVDVGDGDVINGEELPAEPAQASASTPAPVADATPVDIENEEVASDAELSAALAADTIDDLEDPVKAPLVKARDTGTKIPNFDVFRKKLFIFSVLGVLLVGFLVWALFFAPESKIAITARTNVVNISKTLQLKSGAQLDTNQGIIPVVSKQVKKTVSVDFTPTGKKDVGEKATGAVKVKTDAYTILTTGLTVPAGTAVKGSNGLLYTTDAAAVFDKGDAGGLTGIIVKVTATAAGAQYNGATGTATTSAAGVSSVAFSTSPTGGTDKTITVVSADDIAKATTQLQSQDANAVRADLAKQFASDEMIITEAYVVEAGTPTSTPAVDQEAATAKLTAETTYTLLGVKRSDLKAIYDTYLAAQLKGDTSQKVYKSGDEATQFSVFQKVEGGYSIRAIAEAQVGPNIDSNKVANDARGKQAGEVSQMLGSIQGVSNVDVSLSPFWVNRVPNDASRITVTFVLKND